MFFYWECTAVFFMNISSKMNIFLLVQLNVKILMIIRNLYWYWIFSIKLLFKLRIWKHYGWLLIKFPGSRKNQRNFWKGISLASTIEIINRSFTWQQHGCWKLILVLYFFSCGRNDFIREMIFERKKEVKFTAFYEMSFMEVSFY